MMKPAEDPDPGQGDAAGRIGFREWIGKYAAILVALFLTAGVILASPFLQPPFLLSILVVLCSGILYLIRGTRAISLSIIVLAVLYGLTWLPLLIFIITLGIVVGGEIAYRASRGGDHRYLTYLAASSAGGGLVLLYLAAIRYLDQVRPIFLLLILLGVLVAVLLKAALQERNDILMVEGLGVAMTMYLFADLNIPVENTGLLTAGAIIALSFGYIAFRFRVADVSGLFSGSLVGVILIVFADVRWFLVMLVFLVIGSASTRYRYKVKEAAGIAQSHGGVRGYVNVFANCLVGVAAAVLYALSGENPLALALFLGSVATAAADTMGGEIGMTSREPVLITTLEPVPKGTNGGITLLGEGASLVASAAVALSAYLFGLGTPSMLLFVTVAGFAGSNVDSLVGALFENKGFIGNAGTNLAATLAGGLVALVLALFFL